MVHKKLSVFSVFIVIMAGSFLQAANLPWVCKEALYVKTPLNHSTPHPSLQESWKKIVKRKWSSVTKNDLFNIIASSMILTGLVWYGYSFTNVGPTASSSLINGIPANSSITQTGNTSTNTSLSTDSDTASSQSDTSDQSESNKSVSKIKNTAPGVPQVETVKNIRPTLIKTVPQQGSSCGLHAIYNGMTILELLKLSPSTSKKDISEDISNKLIEDISNELIKVKNRKKYFEELNDRGSWRAHVHKSRKEELIYYYLYKELCTHLKPVSGWDWMMSWVNGDSTETYEILKLMARAYAKELSLKSNPQPIIEVGLTSLNTCVTKRFSSHAIFGNLDKKQRKAKINKVIRKIDVAGLQHQIGTHIKPTILENNGIKSEYFTNLTHEFLRGDNLTSDEIEKIITKEKKEESFIILDDVYKYLPSDAYREKVNEVKAGLQQNSCTYTYGFIIRPGSVKLKNNMFIHDTTNQGNCGHWITVVVRKQKDATAC